MRFGMNQNQEVEKIQIENEYIKAEIMTLGATLLSFVEKESGIDVVLGFENLDGYLNQHGSYLGACVGRCANRIKGGHFVLNGKEYHVPLNDGFNSLHGGSCGFSSRLFEIEEQDPNHVVLKLNSEEGDEGYPGNLCLRVCYRLEGRCLYFEFVGESDQDTIFNITNHSYFNLDGALSKSILDHELQINSDRVALIDESGCTTENVIQVENTGFDFRELKKIRDQLNISHPNIESARGYDHNYVFENLEYKTMAILKGEKLMLEIFSDLPGMHVYSGNFLDGECCGKQGNYYGDKNGICFECQYYPNAINYDRFIKPILRKGEIQTHRICYRLSEKK